MEAEAATLSRLLARPTDGAAPVIDAIEVAPGFEAALGAAFGDDLDAPADDSAPVHWSSIAETRVDPTLPFGVQSLADHVRAPAVVSRKLRQIGIVARADGPELQQQLRPGQRLVNREGDLWRWDGFTAAADAETASAQRLASRNRLAVLDGEFAGARDLVAERQRQLEAAAAALGSAGEEETRERAAWREAQRALDAARAALADVEREAGRIAARRSAVDEARNRLAISLAETEATLAAARNGLMTTPEPAQLSDRLAGLRSRVEEDRSALAEARAAVESLAHEAELRSGRLAAIAVERQTWHERAANAEKQIATLSSRREETEAERARLAGEPTRIEEQRKALLSEIEAAEKVRAEAADRLAEGETALAAADKAAREALDLLAEAREQRGRAEERVVAAK
jgi:chromosome segregation protein